MEEVPISDLDLAVSIDAIQDTFPIVNHALDETQRINRNVFLGVTGQPADINSVQTISNKVVDNTNLVTLLDGGFTLQNNVDPTKRALFNLSGITTATTRTYTFPNASSTLADISTAQTLTNKTFTSPIITGGSITNSTISVDSISEFTPANGITIDGLNIKDSKLNTNNSVVSSNITNQAVTPEKLVTGTGSSWAWQTWSPTWSNLTVGNGTTNYAKYTQVGKTVFFKYSLTLGGTSSIASSPMFTLPVTSVSDSSPGGLVLGTINYIDASAGNVFFLGNVVYISTTQGGLFAANSNSTYLQLFSFSSSVPVAYGTGDQLVITGSYEAA